MGRYVAKINEHYVEYGDYFWDYIKRRKPKEYYENKFVEVDYENLATGEEKQIKIPITQFVKIRLLKKCYTWEWKKDDEGSLHKWLYNYIKNELKENIEVYVKLDVYPTISYWYNEKEKYTYDYYLNSPIGDENIIITTKPKLMEITDYSQYVWLTYHCFETQDSKSKEKQYNID
ncbi:MAG: hypothetical protein ACOC33_02830 [bacterium]